MFSHFYVTGSQNQHISNITFFDSLCHFMKPSSTLFEILFEDAFEYQVALTPQSEKKDCTSLYLLPILLICRSALSYILSSLVPGVIYYAFSEDNMTRV